MYLEKGTSNTVQFFQVRHPCCVEYKLKYNTKIYNIIIKNLYFIRLCSIIIVATCFGPIVWPSSG